MHYQDLKDLIGPFLAGYLKYKARQITEKLGMALDEAEDLEQDLVLCLLQKKPQFDAQKSRWEHFARMLIDRKVGNIYSLYTAMMRDCRLCDSLDAENGQGQRWVDCVRGARDPQAMIRDHGSPEEDVELKVDIGILIESLTAKRKRIAVRLLGFGGTETAAAEGIAPGTLHSHLLAMRKTAESMGLKKYLRD